MKKVSIILSLAIIAIAGITLNSCEKSTTESVGQANDNSTLSNINSKKYFEALPHAYAAFMQDQQENGTLKTGAEFIPAIVSSDFFGFIKDAVISFDPDCGCFVFTSGEFVFFNTELDGDDFYRLNPDGTVSVHINSKTASVFYSDIVAGTYAFGEGCNMSMNYTGALVTETYEWDGETYTYQFVDKYSNPSAAAWNGTGKVQFDGVGSKHNLVAHLTANPGWTNVNMQLNIN